MISCYIKYNRQKYPELLRDAVVLGVGESGDCKESQGTFWVLVRWMFIVKINQTGHLGLVHFCACMIHFNKKF